MTARRHGLPVQFEFFAFLPDVLGGANAYLDPQAVRRQTNLVSSVVARFHDVPFLAWDLINEPSFSHHAWQMRANGDSFELAEWNRWLSARYPDRSALADAWNLTSLAPDQTLPVPEDLEFASRGMYSGAEFSEALRFLRIRAGGVRELGEGSARRDSRNRFATTHHRRAG